MGICHEGKTLKEAVEERDRITKETGYIYGVDRLALAEEDPATFTRFQLRLVSTCIAARETAKWVAASPTSMGSGELVFMLAAPEGDCVAASMGLIGHVCSTPYIIKSMANLEFEDDPGISPGDIFSCNDAYYGAPHNYDCYTMVPVFHDGELVAWAVGINHIMDVGAIVAGITASVSPSIFTDGWTYPPMKTGENFKQHKWWELLWHRKTRLGSINVLDDKMRLSGALVIHDKLLEIVEEFGVDYFRQGMREILEREKRQILETIRTQTVPGIYKQMICRPVRYKGIVGKMFPEANRDWLIHFPMETRVTEEGKLAIDFEGVTSQADFQGNLYEPALRVCLSWCWFPIVVHSLTVNTAMDYLIELNCPPGTMTNPTNPFVATSASAQIGGQYTGALETCLNRAFFARGYLEECLLVENAMNAPGYSGVTADGTRWACGDFSFIGCCNTAAAPYRDGQTMLLTTINPQSDMGEVENWEFLKPSQVTLGKKIVPNMCVHGKFRGGMGLNLVELVYDRGQHLAISCLHGSSAETGIYGLGQNGGYSGLGQYTVILHGTNMREIVDQGLPYPTDLPQVKAWLQEGRLKAQSFELYRQETPNIECKDGDVYIGGVWTTGAWGDPLERDLSRVESDVHHGWLTSDVISRIYGVVIGEDGKADVSRTEELRERMRQRRNERSVDVKDWWENERNLVLRKEFCEDVRNMYADSLKYEKFRREFMGTWHVPEEYQL